MMKLTGTKARDLLFVLTEALKKTVYVSEYYKSQDEAGPVSLFSVNESMNANNEINFNYIYDTYMYGKIDVADTKQMKILYDSMLCAESYDPRLEQPDDILTLKFKVTSFNSNELSIVKRFYKNYRHEIVSRARLRPFDIPGTSDFAKDLTNIGALNYNRNMNLALFQMEKDLFQKSDTILKMKIRHGELNCFFDILSGLYDEKQLLEKYGEKTVKQFIGRTSDPFVEELLKSKSQQLNTLLEDIFKEETFKQMEVEKEFVADIKTIVQEVESRKYSKNMSKNEITEQKNHEFNAKLDKAIDKNSLKIKNLNCKKWDEVADLFLEIESIRKNIR